MKLIIGLGNPGGKYIHTRHNVGFVAVDQLAQWLSITVDRSMHQALVGQAVYAGEKIVLAKPQTFMNLSGYAVTKLLNWFKIPPAHLVVIYDDLDLPPGRLRIRNQGSAGGHRGMDSVIGQLGRQDFTRVRIGIGRPPVPGPEVVDWVLSRPSPDEEAEIDKVLNMLPEVCGELIKAGTASAMNKYNQYKSAD